MKHILVADRSPHTRAALRLLLEQLPGVASVDEASTCASCLAALAQSATDVLLLDWGLAGDSGEQLLSSVRRVRPVVVVIVLSSRPEHSREALAAGADLFVSKGDAPEVLVSSLALAEAI